MRRKKNSDNDDYEKIKKEKIDRKERRNRENYIITNGKKEKKYDNEYRKIYN